MLYFNPRSREGSDDRRGGNKTRGDRISIHAPARGATYGPPEFVERVQISIHAPARGATAGKRDRRR